MATTTWPETLQEAIRYFADTDVCFQTAVDMRWKGGPVTCPTCGSPDVHLIATRKVWRCKAKPAHARTQFSVRVGTVMEDSPISLDKWMCAMWLISSAKNGISSYEIGRALGLTQKTAWFLLHRIRLAMQDRRDGGRLGGDVEVDETYIGAKARNMHKGKKARILQGRQGGMTGKIAVMGLLQRTTEKRHSTVRLRVVKNVRRGDLVPHVRENLAPGANLYTDALPSYFPLKDEYVHQVIDHAQSYAEGNVHTNGMENFWSLLKRTLNGTYVSVEPFHLFRYLDEQAFRFNQREMTDSERFKLTAQAVVGKRLTYNALTGRDLSESPAF